MINQNVIVNSSDDRLRKCKRMPIPTAYPQIVGKKSILCASLIQLNAFFF